MRVFVALPLPEEARRKALRLQQALRERVDPAGRLGRLVREENLHLTLAFIGEVPEASARRIAAAMREISPERIAWQAHPDRRVRRPLNLGGHGASGVDAVARQDRADGKTSALKAGRARSRA